MKYWDEEKGRYVEPRKESGAVSKDRKSGTSIRDTAIEQYIKDELKKLIRAEDNISGIKHEDIDNYRGVIAGKRIAYQDVLDEIKRLRRLP